MNAYIIGNGTSRKTFDLTKLKGKGTVYGCNALYRDFMPDVLIVHDFKITEEVFNSGYSGNLWCRRPPEGVDHDQVYDLKHPGQRWATGPTAVYIAAQQHDTLYLLGFDFVGIEDGLINNLYVDTPNYRRSTFQAPNPENWVSNILEVINNNTEKSFTFVGSKPLTEFEKCSNICILDYDTFEKKLNETLPT